MEEYGHNSNYVEKYFFKQRKIRRLILSGQYLCNYKCAYCPYKTGNKRQYNLAIRTIEELKSRNLLDERAVIDVAAGEYTISPQETELLELIKEYNVQLCTNAFQYSTKTSELLMLKHAILLVSVDAGTQETYRKIKGVDGWDNVCRNIDRYATIGMVALKYILIPGINDNEEDIHGFFELAEKTACRVTLTRDCYDLGEFSDYTLQKAALFLKLARKLNLYHDVNIFTDGEKARMEMMEVK